jgi:hypothetical protein
MMILLSLHIFELYFILFFLSHRLQLPPLMIALPPALQTNHHGSEGASPFAGVLL